MAFCKEIYSSKLVLKDVVSIVANMIIEIIKNAKNIIIPTAPAPNSKNSKTIIIDHIVVLIIPLCYSASVYEAGL